LVFGGALPVPLVGDDPSDGVVVPALYLGLGRPCAEAQRGGVLALHYYPLPHVPEPCDVPSILGSGLDAPVNAVVHVRGQVVSYEPLESGTGVLGGFSTAGHLDLLFPETSEAMLYHNMRGICKSHGAR